MTRQCSSRSGGGLPIRRERPGSLEVDEPLMLLTILDVERQFQRRRLACGYQDSLRMLDHVLDSLNIRIGGLETHDERVVAIVVGDVRQDLPLVRDLVADIAPDDLHGPFNGAQHVGELLEVRAPCLAGDSLRCDCHITETHRPKPQHDKVVTAPFAPACAGTIVA